MNISDVHCCLSSIVSIVQFAEIMVEGRLDIRTVSNSARFPSFFASIFIDAQESMTSSLSSSLFLNGAGIHQSSEGEKNAECSAEGFRVFCKRVLPGPMLLCECIVLAFPSVLDSDPRIWERRNFDREETMAG